MNSNHPNKPHKPTAILVALFIAIIICGLTAQAGWALERTVFHPAYYTNLLDDPKLYDLVWGRLWQSFTGQDELPESDSAVYQALRLSFDEKWLKDQFGQATSKALAFVRGEEEQLNIVIAIKERKELFYQELLRLAGKSTAAGLDGPLEHFLQEGIIPDQYTLVSIDGSAALDPQVLSRLSALQQVRRWFRYAPWLAFGLLLLLVLLMAGPGSGLKWFGLGILLSGIVYALVVVLAIKPVYGQPFLQQVTLLKEVFTTYPELMVKAISNARGTLLRVAIYQSAAGLVIIGAGYIPAIVLKKLGRPSDLPAGR